MSSHDSIRSFLARVRTLVYRREGARWTVWALVACAGLALIAPVCARLLVGSRATAVAILATTGLCLAIVMTAAIVLGAIAPRRRWKSDERMARYVGERVGPLKSDLLSAVELARASVAAPGAPSPDLVTALVGATATRIASVEPAALVPPAPVRQALWALAGVAAMHGAVLAAAPALITDGWRNLVAAPRRPFDGAALSTVPLVGDLQLALVYPPYTGRAPQVLPSTSGDFRALPGTEVTITTTALTAASRGELLLEPTDGSAPIAIPLVDPTADPNAPARPNATLRGRFAVTTAARYRFQLEDAQHAKVIEATPHQLELEVDQAPSVQLYAPADELDVTAMKRVELAYVIEDDFGVASAELVWETGHEHGRRPVPIAAPSASSRAQGKLVWDLAEVPLPPGAEITYHLEAKDTDSVRGPNLGVSRSYKLRVWSPRQRHEQSLARQQETAEKVVATLGGRLTIDGEDLDARDQLHKQSAEIVVELGTLVAAYRDDAMADKALPKALEAMRGRLDKLVVAEGKILERVPHHAGDPKTKGNAPRFAGTDRQAIAELEDDAIALADWIDREQMESLLDVADELAAHQRRLAELMDQYAKTGDPKLKAEIDRELRTLDALLAEMAQKRGGMAEDVLDQFVHADALADQRADGCLDEVGRLFAAGQTAAAQAQLTRCGQRLDDATAAMEQSLGQLRGDKFGDQEKKLDELMNDLTDLAADQRAIAKASDELFQRYADRADRMMEDRAKDARRRLQGEVDRLRERIDDIPEAGLTPFAKEELDIVRHRLTDLDQMLGDGDIAEALGMARQAKQSLDTIAAELEAAIDDDPKSPWARETGDALEATERALPPTRKLVESLEELSPSADQILTPDDRKQLDQLRRRQHDTKDRAQRLVDKAKAAGPELPGAAGDEIAKRVGEAGGRMTSAESRLTARDPSGAREDARAAADALDKARERAKGAARQQQATGQGALGDQPIRIPGADEYRAPETFREDILEAMKRKAPSGYDDLVRRYYQELIR